MSRLLTAPLACVFLFSLLAILGAPAPGQADITYLLTATPLDPSISGSGFSLRYVDVNGSGMFSIHELVPGSFSGHTDSLGVVFPTLLYVPVHDRRNYGSPESPYTDTPPNIYPEMAPHWLYGRGAPFLWIFQRVGGEDEWGTWYQTDATLFHDYFTYTQVAVPLPGSVFLLGAGLIPLAWARRKKRGGQ